MSTITIEFMAEKPVFTDGVILYAREIFDHKIYSIVCDGLRKEEVTPNDGPFPRFLDLGLPEHAAQSLFDALWRVGFRPHSGESSVAHVEAMRYHLEDMRKLAFNTQDRVDNG